MDRRCIATGGPDVLPFHLDSCFFDRSTVSTLCGRLDLGFFSRSKGEFLPMLLILVFGRFLWLLRDKRKLIRNLGLSLINV